jgi:SAM-dependent methyltransferase
MPYITDPLDAFLHRIEAMVHIRMLERPARTCLRLLRRMSQPAPPADLENPEWTPFLCNVCGMSNYLPRRQLWREGGRCTKCECYGRLRSMMYAVTAHFSPDEIILARMKPRKDIRGIGCSDWGYTDLLAKKFDYVNTFYDHEPRLDLCNVDWLRWPPGSVDFITCTDVLEHIEPPIERTLENMRRLLKPGGVLVLTVPIHTDSGICEYFPNLNEWEIKQEHGERVLVNHRRDGTVERFDNLCFHGGEGFTLEFRRFSRQGTLDMLEKAGFRIAAIHDKPIPAHGLTLFSVDFVVAAEK